MRCALLIRGRIETLTGGFIYDRFLVEALRRRGHTVEVIALEPKSYGRGLLENLGRRLPSRLAGGSWDLLLQDGLCHPALLRTNRLLRSRLCAPIVAVVHQVLCRQPRVRWRNLAFGWVEQFYFRSLDGILYASRTCRRLARPLVRPDLPQFAAPPGGDRLGAASGEEQISARSLKAGPLELLFVGNLAPVKGLDRLLADLAGLPGESWRLSVAGSLTADRRHVRRIRSMLAEPAVAARVRLRGLLEGAALQALYLGSQVFVMPYAHESFGIAALEAMAFGLPVIGSSRGGVREFVRHSENGFLVAAGDHAALQRHIAELYHDRERLGAMGCAAYRTFSGRVRWEESMRAACVFLEDLAAKKDRHLRA